MSTRPERTQENASLIVIVDDDPDDRFFITRGISRGGARQPIKSFSDGVEAVAYFAQYQNTENLGCPACAVFCDIKMPQMNGFEVLKWFRGYVPWSGVNFYILSGSNEPADLALAASLGATGYLVKFPSDAEFAHLIARTLQVLPARLVGAKRSRNRP